MAGIFRYDMKIWSHKLIIYKKYLWYLAYNNNFNLYFVETLNNSLFHNLIINKLTYSALITRIQVTFKKKNSGNTYSINQSKKSIHMTKHN